MTTATEPITTVTMRAAAEAALSVLPVTAALTVGEAADPTANPALSTPRGVAVCAQLSGRTTGTLAIFVNQELVDALQVSPLGQLDLATAVGPALDAAAGVLGCAVTAGLEQPSQLALVTLAHGTAVTVVPMTADGSPHAALMLSVPIAPHGTVTKAGAEAGRERRKVSGLDLLHGVEMEVTVELGRTRMTVRELLSLTNGSVIELDRVAGSPADVLVNRRLIARGEIVVVDENFGIRITEIVASTDTEAERV